MKPKDPDTFIDIGASITRLLLIASGQGTAASLIGEGTGLLKNLRSLLGSGGQRAVSAEKIAADVADQLFREHQDISEADWQVAATHVAPLIDRLSEKDRLAAGYDWTALRPVLLELGGAERRRKLADESARRAFDWALEVVCQRIADLFTEKEALASLLEKVDEVQSGVRQLLDRPAGASKTRDVVNDHIEMLRELAPDRLEDRESEMADLDAFVRSSDDVWYAMEADMVSGKTAVMASFALKFAINPPEGVHMASFFIRRIGGDGNDRGRFAFVMGAQLADILGDEYVERVHGQAQRTEFCKLLRRAATACRSDTVPQTLVLLIDGVDEDSYFENPGGADAESIVSLLPRHLLKGVKIITASRPNPRLPEDVRCDAKRKIVFLKSSPIAEKNINRYDIEAFFGSYIAVDIVAFLAACDGALTVKDLRKLLTMRGHQRIRTWDVREYVDRSPGRILTPIDVGFSGQEVLAYRLGHDVVTRAVIRELDPDSFGEGDEPEDERWWAPIREKALVPYRAIIRNWVKECVRGRNESTPSRGWGKSTPSYVLSGACFDLMLNDKRDDGSSVRVVLDRGRYNEMRRRSGRRSHVLRMIDRECFAILDMNHGELPEDAMTSIFEVVESGKLLVQASTYIPGLPKLYVSHLNITPEAAMDMIMAVDDPKDRLSALGETMKAAIESGHGCAFLTLLPTMFSSLVIYRDLRDEILHLLVDIIVSIGDAANKSKFGSNESADPENQINEVIVLVEMIESLLRSLSSFEKIDDLDNDARTIASLLVVAEDIAERIEEPWERAKALAEVACTLARTGQTDIVLDIAGHTEDPGLRAKVLAEVACTLARAAQTDRARRVAENAVNVAERIEEPWERAKALAEVACTLARADQTDIVLNVIEKIDNLRIGARLTLDCECVEALLKVAGALANTGQTDVTIKISERIDNFEKYAEILAGVAGALVWEGQTDRTVDIAERIKHPRFRAEALAGVAGALAQTGQTDMARRVAENAVNVAGRIDESWMRAEVLAGVAGALGRAGQTDMALAVVGRIEDSWVRAGVFTIVVSVLVRAGQTDRAADIAEQIEDPEERVWALMEMKVADMLTGADRTVADIKQDFLRVLLSAGVRSRSRKCGW